MNRHKKIASILLIALVHLFAFGSAWAGTSASINVSGNEGAITVSASATFLEDIHCDSRGQNCHPVNNGNLSVYLDGHYLGGSGGDGSANFSKIVDGGSLSQGSHTFKAVANDHEGASSSDSQTIQINNTPVLTVTALGTVSGLFDLSGTVQFKESINGDDGSINIYIDNNLWASWGDYNGSVDWHYSAMTHYPHPNPLVDAGWLSQGQHTLKIVATARNGATTVDVSTFTVDIAPVLSVKALDTVSGLFDITGSADFKESYANDGSISIYIDNQLWASWSGDNGSADWHYSTMTHYPHPNPLVDAGWLSQGQHTLKVVATARNGATTVDVSTFTVDIAPVLSMKALDTVSGLFDITGSAGFKESYANDGSINIYIDNKLWASWGGYNGSVDWRYSTMTHYPHPNPLVDAGWLSQGQHTLKIVATARNGATTVDVSTFTVDIAPVLSVNPPGVVSQPDLFDITGFAQFKESYANDGSINIYIDNKLWSSWSSYNGSVDWHYSTMIHYPHKEKLINSNWFSLGDHAIKVVAIGRNGAQTVATTTVTIANCNIKINSFSGTNGTINATGGETVTLSANITDSSGKGIKWTMDVAGRGYSGSGKSVSVTWDGKDGSGRLLPSGSYTATLHAETDDGKCSADASLPIRVENDSGCSLKVVFGSTANIATGNLAHEQELFTTSGTGLNTAITLYYNSLDSHNGILGRGWGHTYDITAKTDADGSVLIRLGNGSTKYYQYVDDAYIAPPGDYSTLLKSSEGYILIHKDGTRYNFNTSNVLSSVVDRNGNTMRFAYNYGTLTSITDSVGRVTYFLYDINNRLVEITDPAGKAYGFTMTGNTLTRVTTPDGGIWSYGYDADGFLTSRTDAEGYTTRYTYDGQHRVKSAIDPEGKTRTITYSTATGSEKTAQVTEKDGSIWQFTFDSTHGNLVAKIDPAGNAITYSYDDNHNLLRKTEADGSVTSYSYDSKGNMVSSVDPLGNQTSYTYNSAGQVTSITDPAGQTTAFSYDSKGNLIKVTDATGGTTKYSYDAAGRVVSITNPAGQVTRLAYDAQGNVIAVTDPAGATTSLAYDAGGRVVSQTDAAGQITRFAYDAGGNLAKVTDPHGKITQFGYDASGNRTSVTDANGRTTTYEYDYAHRVVQIVDALGQATSLTYAEAGCATCGAGQQAQPATVTDANGHTTWFQYDTLGRLVREIDQLGARTSYQYDAKGNVVARTDGEGRTTTYRYDALNRLVGKVYPDKNQALFKYDVAGRLLSAANQHIGYVMSYDGAGRLTIITDSNQRTIRYQYDTMGNRVKMTTPEGKVVQYSYDEANRLIEVASFLGTFDLGYDTLGRRTSLALPNGITTGYGYDAAGRLTQILAQAGGRRGRGEVVNAFTYTLDAVGNRLSKAVSMSDHGHKDATYQYTYDAVYQLLQSLPSGHRGHSGQEAERYTYDPVGNRLTGPERKDTYRYNTVNELMASRKTGFRYDYNGNLVARGEWSYEYDYENRLIRATRADGDEIKTVSFKYDPFGRRIEKKVEEIEEGKVKGRTYTYVYDNEDMILEYRVGSDGDDDDRARVKVSRFVHGPGIDEPLAIEQKGRIYYYHADGLGSIVSLTDNKGRVVESFDYSAFGFMQRRGGEVKQPYAYTGREWDKELGLYYYRARYYDPVVGRFISKDPISFSGGDVNLYRYVQNDPVDWVDPSGLWSVSGGAGGGFHVGPFGVRAGTSIGVDECGTVCVTSTICTTLGGGLLGYLGLSGSVSTGNFSEGTSTSWGVFKSGGAGRVSSGSITSNGSGVSVGQGQRIEGVGGGVAAGAIRCEATTICF